MTDAFPAGAAVLTASRQLAGNYIEGRVVDPYAVLSSVRGAEDSCMDREGYLTHDLERDQGSG
jgi:hypothetical protein